MTVNFFVIRKSSNRHSELSKLKPIAIMSRGHSGSRVLAWITHLLRIPLWTDQNRKSGDTDRKLSRAIKQIVKNDPFITANRAYKSTSRAKFEKTINQYYHRLGQPQSPWGWKFPETYLMAPLVYDVFPDVKFVHLIRDGRDIAFKNHLTDDPRRKIGRRILQRLDALEQPSYIQTALSWKFQVDAFDQFKKLLPTEQLYELTFEALCTRPQKIVTELTEFFDVPITPACQHYIDHEIIATKVGQYREQDPKQVIEVENIIQDTLLRHGYKLIRK